MGLQTSNFRGSDCTGLDGASLRTLTLSNILETEDDSFLVFVNGLVMIPTEDFTVVHKTSNSVITFINPIFNDQYILIQYGEGYVESITGAYCSVEDVRLLTNLTISDISSTDLTNIISKSVAQINSDINVYVSREYVSYIDQTRTNLINGVNKDFYTRNWDYYLADMNNDGFVNTSDVIFYQVDSNGVETRMTVSSIDDEKCKITLSSAPTPNNRYYIDYSYSVVREGTVDPRVKLATIFLTAAYCYAKLNIGCSPNVSFGSTRITKDMDSFNHYYQRYLDVINQINSLEEVHSKLSDTF